MDYGEKKPILIKEREIQATQSSPVITYKLSEEELEKYRRMDFKKNDAKKPIILTTPKKKMGVKEMNKEKQVKKLTVEVIKDCLSKGMTEKEIAEEYEKDERIVRMLIAKMNKPAKKAKKEQRCLKVTSLIGLMEYHIDHDCKTVTIKDDMGTIEIGLKDVNALISELQELQKIIG